MDWVKLATGYYNDPKVAGLPDADCELMFLRSIAYCGGAETGGAIPKGVLLSLGRRRHRACAVELVKAGLWAETPTGWELPRFADRQAELMRLVEKKQRDALRHREARANVRGHSADVPRNVSPPESEKRREEKEGAGLSKSSALEVVGRSDDDLDKIAKATKGSREWADKVRADILGRATTPVLNETAYVLRAIGDEPDRYRETWTPPPYRKLKAQG